MRNNFDFVPAYFFNEAKNSGSAEDINNANDDDNINNNNKS